MRRRRVGVTRSTQQLVGLLSAVLCCAIAAFLLAPTACGWKHTTLSREQVLQAARRVVGDSRMEAKYQSGLLGHGEWVVASTSTALVPSCGYICGPAMWSVAYVPDVKGHIPLPSMSDGPGTGTAWPAFFEAMPDEAAPSWWPPIVPRPLAPVLAAVSLAAALVVLVLSVRGRRKSLSPPMAAPGASSPPKLAQG